jgi:hypothetical protein
VTVKRSARAARVFLVAYDWLRSRAAPSSRENGEEAPARDDGVTEPDVGFPSPREWNLWELERRSRELAGASAQDEEATVLFVYLRSFATADGVLPKEFDELVRESFPELIQAA